MQRVAALAIGLGLSVVASASAADRPCTCRSPTGTDIPLGELACLPSPTGMVLARCEMVLNNTSWQTLAQPCPQARASPRESRPVRG